MRRGLLLVGVLLIGGQVRAEEHPADDPARFRLGVNVALVGVPRLVNLEAYARVHPYLAVTLGWSTCPGFASNIVLKWAGAQSDTTEATLNGFSAWELALRVFPLRGVFFFGLGFGWQVVDGQFTEKPSGTSGTAFSHVEAWVLTPRIGLQWVWRSGFAVGVDGGIQFPLSHASRLTLEPDVSSSAEVGAQNLIHFGASLPLPSFNVRVGYHFG